MSQYRCEMDELMSQWDAVRGSSGFEDSHEPSTYGDAVLNSMPDGVVRIDEAKDGKAKIIADVDDLASSPNPVRVDSLGMDQGPDPVAMGQIYGPEDIEKLADMKAKLHDLQSKLAAAEALDKSVSGLAGKITKAAADIDDLSNEITSLTQVSSQGN